MQSAAAIVAQNVQNARSVQHPPRRRRSAQPIAARIAVSAANAALIVAQNAASGTPSVATAVLIVVLIGALIVVRIVDLTGVQIAVPTVGQTGALQRGVLQTGALIAVSG
jgi:hypothetical protein